MLFRSTGFISCYFDLRVLREKDAMVRKLAKVVEQSGESVVISNVAAEIEYVNETFVRRSGYTRAEVIGRNPRLLQSSLTPRATYDALWQALKRGECWEGEFHNRCRDGSIIVEEAVIAPLSLSGSTSHYVGVCRDVTERVRRAAVLRLLEVLARAVNEVETAEAAMSKCVELICEYGH